jgi:hypothetical protein
MADVANLNVNIGAKTGRLKSGMNKAKREVTGFSKSINKLGGLMAGAFAVTKIAGFAGEAVMLAGTLQGVESAFKNIATAADFDSIQKATRGTVSELELMKKAVQAKNFNIPIKELGSLFEFARRRAKATGESVEFLTQSIVTGLGRKSVLILDNLGISTSQLRDELGGVAVASADVAELTAAVGRIAQKSFSDMGDDIETTSEKVERMKASFANLKTEIGEKLTPVVDVLADSFQKLSKSWKEITAADQAGWMERLTEDIKGLNREDAFPKLLDTIKVLEDEILRLSTLLKEQKKGWDLLHGPKQIKKINTTASALEAARASLKELTDLAKDKEGFDSFIANLNVGNEAVEKEIGLLQGAREKLKGLKEEKELAYTQAHIDSINREIIKTEEYIKTLENLRVTGGKSIDKIRSAFFRQEARGFRADKIDTSGLDRVIERNDRVIEKNKELEQSYIDLGQVVQEAAMTMVDGLEEGLIRLFQGGRTIGSFMDDLLGQVGKFISSMGKMLVAYGVGMEAFKQAFENPYVAIAAGAALIALGAAVQSLSQKAPAGGGAPTSTGVGRSNRSSFGGGSTIQIESVLRGNDIYLSNKRSGEALELVS